jgi:hypothetical protein
VIIFILFFQIVPETEKMSYKTNEKGKIGSIDVVSNLDSIGYHVIYTSDRIIDVYLDSSNLGTRYVTKVIGDDTVLQISTRESNFEVYFKGRWYRHHKERPVYDRHTLDYALRGFDYRSGFEHRFRLHVPELTIINADLKVIGEATIDTPAGTFDCWEVSMKPRIIFLNRVFFFFIEKEYPHRFVKYSDSSGDNYIMLESYEAGSRPID